MGGVRGGGKWERIFTPTFVLPHPRHNSGGIFDKGEEIVFTSKAVRIVAFNQVAGLDDGLGHCFCAFARLTWTPGMKSAS